VVPQELVFDPFLHGARNARDPVGYFGIRDNGDWIDEILHHLDLVSKADANMRSLSGGMKRRVLVGQALVHKPPVIVLDEPTAGVDVELRQSLWTFIRKLNRDGHTIILTTHYLEEAEALCTRIAMLKSGKVVALDTKQNCCRASPGSPCASSRRAFRRRGNRGCCARTRASSSSGSSATRIWKRCSRRCARRHPDRRARAVRNRPRAGLSADHGDERHRSRRARDGAMKPIAVPDG
jgi:ABC-type multidrug transport system ATPase subunit